MGCSPDDRACQDDVFAVEALFTNEKPRHRVTISRGFWMGKTEVTVGVYRRFAQATQGKVPEDLVLAAPRRLQSPGFPQEDHHPIVYVTWDDAAQYCQWAGGRLPTEAEWEYAARAGSPAARYGNLDEIAWYADNSGRSKLDSAELWESASPANVRDIFRKRLRDNGNQPQPVGKKTPNGLGLYDMLGNVWEYCADWYDENYYQVSEEKDPEGPHRGKFQVMRGAAWRIRPKGVRVSIRRWMLPDHRFYDIGFRCVRGAIP
jgi:formylglycine-generating enzyme required for sulfatase activity